MKAKEKLLIVDGHNLLFQMFFGMPNRIVNKDGKAIQGVIGFVGALNKIIKQVEPTHMVVLFDGEHENSRTELLPEYKGNREDYSLMEEEENPFSQLPDVYRALDYMGIRHCETEEVETDDVIASYVLTYGMSGKDKKLTDGISIVVSSWDSDFFQLIRENVTILRYRGKCTTICDVAYLKEKFDIAPEVYVDFKSLVGDAADNIKGAQGIGPKTASALLKQYGSLRGILDHAEEVAKKKVREVLIAEKDRLLVNYEIIKLSDKVKLPFAFEKLVWHNKEYRTNDVVHGIGLM